MHSGRVGRSDVFFTALRRQSSDDQSVGASERDLEEMQHSQVSTEHLHMLRMHNPAKGRHTCTVVLACGTD
jgi:hypothetical protein